jgi:hypothetical protein
MKATNLQRRHEGAAMVEMIRRWWKRYLFSAGASYHLERCPFCGQMFDIRDLGEVFLHRDHLLASGGPPPEEEMSPADVVPFRRRHEG